MKVKLLKRIRRRFGYYKNDAGQYVVVDKALEQAYKVDRELIARNYNNAPEEVDEEMLFGMLKEIITKPYEPKYFEKRRFNFAKNKLKRKQDANIL